MHKNVYQKVKVHLHMNQNWYSPTNLIIVPILSYYYKTPISITLGNLFNRDGSTNFYFISCMELMNFNFKNSNIVIDTI